VENDIYHGKTVIIATGAEAKWMGLPSEQKLRGLGVSACATCDGFFFKGKEIAVIGGGDTALEEATFLTNFATKVTLIHRRDKLRASKIMQEKAFKNPKIAFIWDSGVEEVLDVGQRKVTGLKLRNLKTDEISVLPCQGLFVAIGHAPNTALFQGLLAMDEKGYLIVTNNTHTSIAGVFAAGDVKDHVYRQAITAAGSGCMAALDAQRYLESVE
jgi:thioredoxin reductase (NADPH)